MKDIIKYMFKNVQDDDVIKAAKVPGFSKPDLKIMINEESHYLSIKYGYACQVHKEELSVFVEWLSDKGVSQRTIDALLTYHYGDGTTDGTGERRMHQQEVLRYYSEAIREMNAVLNQDRFFVRDFVRRVVFDGNEEHKPSADFIYHGDIEEGVICSKSSMLSYIKRKTFERLVNPHIGPIMFRPYARYLSGEETHPEKRHQICFEWYRIEWDIAYIRQYDF